MSDDVIELVVTLALFVGGAALVVHAVGWQAMFGVWLMAGAMRQVKP